MSFVIDESFSRFDKSGFLTCKQKWETIQTKTSSHYIDIRKWRNSFKKLTGTLWQSQGFPYHEQAVFILTHDTNLALLDAFFITAAYTIKGTTLSTSL